ncbi:BSD domain-containing protein 1 isoform X2 [Rhipicephalus sanguineus]|uniref:BSD domain-containing protein 1 isoform X2 n=1 Tax=Rhipicephalus sanguineus TaxID=34632 RepID=UPI001893A94F|nr:BSD domain-containing protein 1 isoform X2 [Rhipicephalus sanguineus]
MAEGTNPDEGTPWWNSWIQTAKDKLDGENSVTSKAKEGLTSLIGSISEVLSPTWDPADDELSIIHDNEVHPVDRWQACLHSILVDRNTYCHEPDSPPEVYETWLETFNMEDHKDEIADILLNYSEVQRLYDELVPGAVSHEEFWQRYFFRAFQLWQAEEELVNSVQESSERLSISGVDSDHLMETLSGPGGSRFLGSRPMVVPPNTPNAPSAEQSGSNSPQPAKAAPSPAGDAGCDILGTLTPEEEGEDEDIERTLPSCSLKQALEASVLETHPISAADVLAARLSLQVEATTEADIASVQETAAVANASESAVSAEEQDAKRVPTTADATKPAASPAAPAEASATAPGPGSESSSGKDLSDWEEFELELADTDAATTASVAKPASHSASEADDDWEKWE